VWDVCRLQNDHVSPAARATLSVLEQLPDTAPGARLALDLLRGGHGAQWDRTMAVDLAQPTLFEHWFRRRLRPALLRVRLPPLVGPERVEDAVRAVSPDESAAVNAPGQSGDPRSPHHDDLTELWSRGRYFPLAYSREAVDRHRESTLHLLPRAE
jgi:acyl-homoserine lactone acylase PvdQ